MKLRAGLCLTVCLALLAAGCGGGKKVATTTTTLTPSATPGLNAARCARLLAVGTRLAAALQAPTARMERRIGRASAVLAQLAATAPPDIRADLQTLATAMSQYAQAFTKAGVKPGTPLTQAQRAKLVAAATIFSTPKLSTAEQHLITWADRKCGSAPTTTTG